MSVRLTVVVAVLAFCACQSGAETITAEEAAAGVYTDGHRLGEAVYGSGGAFASGKVAIPNMIPKVHIREINVKQKKTLQQAKIKAIKAKEAALKAKLAAKKKQEKAKKAAEKKVQAAQRALRQKKAAAGRSLRKAKRNLRPRKWKARP